MQALGLLGKLLTGPWMKKFYQSASGELRHLDAVDIVRTVVDQLEEAGERPLAALARTTDFLGQDLDLADETLQQLRCVPVDSQNFSDFFKSCCVATVTVLKRQYARYFAMVVTEDLLEETRSARTHNIDAEEIMGMFSAYRERAKAACMDYLETKMRARKGRVQ
jgi:hypothetical protein